MQGTGIVPAAQTAPDRYLRLSALGVAVFAISGGLAWLSLLLEMDPEAGISLWGPVGGAAPFWAPAGFAVAALALFAGERRVAAAVAVFLSELVIWSMLSAWWVAVAMAAMCVMQAFIGSGLLRRYQDSGGVLGGVRDVLGHVAAAFLAPVIPAMFAAAVVVAAEDESSATAVAQTWYLASALGILLFTPFIVVWTRRGRRPLLHRVWQDLLATGFVIGLPTLLVFSMPSGADNLLVPLAYLTLPALLWTAWRTGPRGATAAILSVSLLAVSLTAAGTGPFTTPLGMTLLGWVSLQAYLVISALTTMFFTAAVAQQNEATQSLEERNAALAEAALMNEAFEHAVEGIVRVGSEGNILYGNRAFEDICPTFEDGGHVAFVDLVDAADREAVEDAVGKAITAGRSRLECRIRGDGRATHQVEMTLVAETGTAPDASSLGFHVFVRDISDRKAAQVRLAHQADHDALTGLANRVQFLKALRKAISRRFEKVPAGPGIAVLYLDLDRFKLVNDSLGHEAGDRLLRAVSRRLLHAIGNGDLLARLGGDEFAILVREVEDLPDVLHAADRVHRVFDNPFNVGGDETYSSVSIGIAASWDDTSTATDLLRHADIAMYKAKDAGRARTVVFDDDLRDGIHTRLELENALHRALERNELQPWYQPFFDASGRSITGMEALCRWLRPGTAPETAASFIESAEECGLVVPLGSSMLTSSCAQVAQWHATGLFPTAARLHVNVSPRQVSYGNLADTIRDVLTQTNLPPQLLCVEVTETVLLHDPDRSRIHLAQLAEAGVGISIDDFGTGYSSLSHLRRLPLDNLKIDRSFVQGILHRQEDAAIVEATIMLAHSLGVTVIAEGVESDAQRERLEDMGCDHVQGFHLARPAPADEMGEMLSA